MRPLPFSFLEWIYLLVVAPATLALTVLIAPLEASDELMHLLRADAVSHGTIVPVIVDSDTGEPGAGGLVDRSLAEWIVQFNPVYNADIVPTSRRHLFETFSVVDRGLTGNVAHSNTAIYPPLLYLQSAASIAMARTVGLPVALWLYAGRLANATAAIIVFLALMRRYTSLRPFLLTLSALPITLFQTATVSADAALLPATIAFACLLAGLYMERRTSPRTTAALAVATVVLCVGKVAYLPLALFPPLMARQVDRHWSRRAVILAAVSIASLLL